MFYILNTNLQEINTTTSISPVINYLYAFDQYIIIILLMLKQILLVALFSTLSFGRSLPETYACQDNCMAQYPLCMRGCGEAERQAYLSCYNSCWLVIQVEMENAAAAANVQGGEQETHHHHHHHHDEEEDFEDEDYDGEFEQKPEVACLARGSMCDSSNRVRCCSNNCVRQSFGGDVRYGALYCQ
jgi:hypothetical protein